MSEPRNEIENRHPSVMFEIIAKDQQAMKTFYSKVFAWRYQSGTGGIAYVHFGERTLPLLGASARPTQRLLASSRGTISICLSTTSKRRSRTR